jgi:two-component system, NarL family, response regulator LiaR
LARASANNLEFLLVASDDDDTRELVSNLFRRAGLGIEEVRSGEEALATCQERRPALILVDLKLEDKSGYTLCYELRQRFGADLPVILLAGERSQQDDRVASLLIGADDYLVKPIDQDELVARGHRLLARSQRKEPTRSFQLTPREITLTLDPPKVEGNGKPIRVLIVDDHSLVAEGIEYGLRTHGLNVVGIVATARQAISTARELRPDIVLMDVGLPDQDGVSAGRRILADRSETKVIVLTGQDDADLARRAIQSGLHGYLSKSASIMELVAAIIATVGGHAMMPERAVRFMAGTPAPEEEETLLLKQLTDRERQVLALLTQGLSPGQIADRLVVSPNTVRTHVQNIRSKLLVRSRLEAVAFAMRHGLVRAEQSEQPRS